MKPKITGNDSAAYRVPFDDPDAEERILRRQRETNQREARRHKKDATHAAIQRTEPLPK